MCLLMCTKDMRALVLFLVWSEPRDALTMLIDNAVGALVASGVRPEAVQS